MNDVAGGIPNNDRDILHFINNEIPGTKEKSYKKGGTVGDSLKLITISMMSLAT